MALWEWEACPSICPSGGGPAPHKRGLCGGTVTSESGGGSGRHGGEGGERGRNTRVKGGFSVTDWKWCLYCPTAQNDITHSPRGSWWSMCLINTFTSSPAPQFEDHFTDTQPKLNLKHQILWLFGNFLWHLIWQDNTPSLHNRHAVDYKMCVFCFKSYISSLISSTQLSVLFVYTK